MKEDISHSDLYVKTVELFDFMIQHDGALTRQQAIEFLGTVFAGHYLLMVKALEAAGKASVKRGPGGIYFPARQRAQKEIVPMNEAVIKEYIEDNFIPDTESETHLHLSDEETLYEPLKLYLKESGSYDFVKVHGNARTGGGAWKNPDLVAIKIISDIKYTVSIYPQITAIEVKKEAPSIKDLQQARSYLMFCHMSYIAFYLDGYTGKNHDYLVSQLKDINIWEEAQSFGLGIIVAYRPTVRSKEFYFQMAREAPPIDLPPKIIESTVDTYFEANIQDRVSAALKAQIIKILQK